MHRERFFPADYFEAIWRHRTTGENKEAFPSGKSWSVLWGYLEDCDQDKKWPKCLACWVDEDAWDEFLEAKDDVRELLLAVFPSYDGVSAVLERAWADIQGGRIAGAHAANQGGELVSQLPEQYPLVIWADVMKAALPQGLAACWEPY